MTQVSPKTAVFTVAATTALAVGFLFFRPAHQHEVAPTAQPAQPAANFHTSVKLQPLASGTTDTLELATAIERDAVSAEFDGNGREKMWMTVRNKDSKSLRLRLAAGQVLESGRNRVVLLRAQTLEVQPGRPVTFELQAAATTIMNEVRNATYQLVPEIQVRLGSLLAYLENHPEVSPAAAQTAVLAITENQPVRAFAKFAQLGGNLPSQFQNSAFKVEVVDILAALTALREIGFPEQELALTVDPQLKIEAMIDPLAHALAMRYYGIKPAEEWSYWKHELLQGEMSTRHYALYGISHYFPEIAVQMLPTWARESRTNVVFRTSAVQALAETRLPEALPALRQIEYEMGGHTEIGKTAHNAAEFLVRELNKPSAGAGSVTFRTSKMLSKL